MEFEQVTNQPASGIGRLARGEYGSSWQLVGQARHQAHEYTCNGTAKLLTLFQPASGQVHVKGVTSTTNAVIHTWLNAQFTDILAARSVPEVVAAYLNRFPSVSSDLASVAHGGTPPLPT